MSEEKIESKGEGASLEEMQTLLRGAFDAARDEAREAAVSAVRDFAKGIEEQRSHKPPIPKRGDDDEKTEKSRGDTISASRFTVGGLVIEREYRKMERGLSETAREEFRASRNPKIDEAAKRWAHAVQLGDVTGRIRAYHEVNDLYLESLGMSRAALLEGDTTGENPLADGSGAELLPLPLSGQLMVERDRISKMRALATVFPMSAQVMRIPILPTTTAATRAENAAFSDNTPTVDSALLRARSMGVQYSASRDMLEDSAFNLVNQLTRVAGQAIGSEENDQFATSTGTGSDITEGLDGATITDVPEATPSSIAYGDIVDIYYGLPEQYRREAVFLMAASTLGDVVSLVDTIGMPIFQSSLQAPLPMTDSDPAALGFLFGKPVYEFPVADDVIYFGNPLYYAIGQRAGIRVYSDVSGTTQQSTWVIDQRIDGRVIPTSAVDTNNAWRKIVY